jgi:DNA-binding IclR family transcriptional regulator
MSTTTGGGARITEGKAGAQGPAIAVQAVDRVLRMLEAFRGDRRELGVSDFARLLGVHKSTASRLAAALVRRGFLERGAPTQRLRLGPEVGRLGRLVLGDQDLVTLARDAMDRLAAATRETVNLAVLHGHEVVNVAQADGPHFVGVGVWTGQRTPLHCAANGKVLLAFSGAPLPPGRLRALTPRTLTDRRQLREHLAEVRRRGWAANVGELEEGLHAVAVPVLDGAGRCRAALSVSGPAYRMPPERLSELAEQARQAAAEITAGLEGGIARFRANGAT